MNAEPTVLIYDEIAWDDMLGSDPAVKAAPAELVEKAKKLGARRKKLANGRCRNHGRMSTGPRTPEGRRRALMNLKQFRRLGSVPK